MPRPLPTEQQWGEVEQFMREHSPERLAALQKLHLDGDRLNNLKKMIFARYSYLKTLGEMDHDAYDLKLRQLDLEDKIFGLATAMRAAADEGDDRKREQIRGELRTAVGKLVDLGMAEREARLNRLEKSIHDQRTALTQETQKRDDIIDARVNAAIASPDPFPRGGGGGRRWRGGSGQGFGGPGDPRRGFGAGGLRLDGRDWPTPEPSQKQSEQPQGVDEGTGGD
jgi:hypothetical protein